MHARRHAPTLLLLTLLFAGAGCGRAEAPTAGPVNVALVPGKTPIETIVRVSGLSGAELRALKDARLDEPAWQTLMRVTVSDNDVAPVTGQFLVTDDAVEFHPRFPFDRGRSYSVRFDPGRLPVPRSEAALDVRLRAGGPEPSSPTPVVAIYPSATVWPENMLRLYVGFSDRCRAGRETKYIHLVDDDGRRCPMRFLPPTPICGTRTRRD
jgi:hypothetical protein